MSEATATQTTERFIPLSELSFEQIMKVENSAYPVPWTEGVMKDCLLKPGYQSEALLVDDELTGYFIVQNILEECHLLNFCIAPEHQGQGLSHKLMCRLMALCEENDIERIILEVRRSQNVARKLYTKVGFELIGERKGYYPTASGEREDALVMARYCFS